MPTRAPSLSAAPLAELPDGYGRRLAFHPDGRRFVVGDGDALTLFDGVTAALALERDGTFTLGFSPDGKTLYAAPDLVDLAAGKPRDLPSPLAALAGKERGWGLVAAALSPDGQELYVSASRRGGGSEGSERLAALDPKSRKLVHPLWTGGDRHAALAVGARYVAAAFTTVRLWRRGQGGAPKALAHHTFEVTALAFGPADALLLSGDAKGGAALWDPATGARRADWPAHTGRVEAAAWDATRGHLWTGGGDGELRAWDPSAVSAPLLSRALDGAVEALAISPDGKRLLASVGAPNHRLVVFELR
jgi:WD40 repeat protein